MLTLRRCIPALAVCAALAGCGLTTHVHGGVDVTGDGNLATLHTPVDDCRKANGGVELTSGNEVVLRATADDLLGVSLVLVDDPNVVEMSPPPGSCRQLYVDVHLNGTRVNNDDEIDGSLDIDCDLPGGGTLVAHASFENCQ
jgi:hypothetical protein